MDDVELNKAAAIERCIARVCEEYAENPQNLHHQTKQDSIILNLQRACEAALDLAMHRVRIHKLGIPQDSRDAFELLYKAGLIAEPLNVAMKRMVGFRNTAVRDDQVLNLAIVRAIIEHHLQDLSAFATISPVREKH